MAFMVFPSKGMQALSFLIYILGVSILAHCLSRRLAAEDWTSWSSIREMTWARVCILLIFLDSWLFLFASGMLTFGVGLESKELVCSLAIYLCVVFYATSKLLIYSFLVEKVYLVWSPSTASPRRFKSPIYLSCLAMIAVYGGVIASMFAGRIHYLREGDGVCIIGLEQYSSLTLVVYDLLINIVLTLLFLWPVFRVNLTNPRLKSVATRTLLASAVALTTSTASPPINMLVLALLQGHENGWVCLGSCGADVIFNALAVFWVTKRRGQSYNYASSIGQGVNNPVRESRRPPEAKIVENANDMVVSSSTAFWQAPTYTVDASHQTPTPTPPTTHKAKYNLAFSSTPRESRFEDIEMQSTQKPSLFRSMTGLFRSDLHSSEQALQVTVTTIITDDVEVVNENEESVDSK